jgi:site-specific recombinase XerC
MASLRKKGRVWYFRWTDARGKQHERAGCSDKRATEAMAAAKEAEVARQKAGLSDPRAERLAKAERTPLAAHLEDFASTLRAKRRDPKHVRQTLKYARRVLDMASVRSISGIKLSPLMDALAELGEQGHSARTVNAHSSAVKQFSAWLLKDGRSADHPLLGLARLNEETDRRRVRRHLTDDELRRLIDVTRTAPAWRDIPGLDRSVMYLVGASTGLRRKELRSLTPESFRLDQRPPTIVCKASHTKNSKEAEQPVPEAVAAVLVPWLATKPAGQPVFGPRGRTRSIHLAMAQDLKRAGIEVGSGDNVVDMHSLRHSYITSLAKSGLPIKALMTLARHSDPKLTMKVYSHLSIHDTAAALEALPDLTSPRPTTDVQAATGTHGAAGHIKEVVALPLPCAGDASRHPVASPGDLTAAQANVSGTPREAEKVLGKRPPDASRRLLATTGRADTGGGGLPPPILSR